jgi:IS30 family transposase
MATRCRHVGLEERRRLRGMIEMGLSLSGIARRPGRRRSAIHREIARNRRA